MSMRNRLLTITAVSALTAATAVPALALENEFHGMFRVKGFVTNYQGPGAATTAVAGVAAPGGMGTVVEAKDTYSYIEQRARIMYVAKASDDLKLVTHFEIDGRWGDSQYATGRNVGAGMGADQTNIETKSAYLDFNFPGTKVNTKVGIQPWVDSYKGIFTNTDTAGLLMTGNFNPFTGAFGYFRLNDTSTAGAGLGRADRDLFIFDAKLAPTKNLSLGASYYLVRDDRVYSTQDINTVGANAEIKAGPATFDAFALYQFGEVAKDRDLKAWAAQAAAKFGMGMATLRAAVLYASGEQTPLAGDGSDFQSLNATTSKTGSQESSYYASDMLLLMRSKWAINSDNAIVSSTNNLGQGLVGGFVGVDMKFSDKMNAAANVGAVWVDKRNALAGSATDDSKYVGTEINAQLTYNLYSNMSATLQGAYVVLGDYWEGVSTVAGQTTSAGEKPDNPFLGCLMLNYTF